MKDSKFCYGFLTQLLILFESLQKPVSATQKKTFVITEPEVIENNFHHLLEKENESMWRKNMRIN